LKMFSGITLEVDPEFSTGYVSFSKGNVANTVALSSDLNLDLDSNGSVLGLELLHLDAKLPINRLVSEFGLDGDMLEKLSEKLLK